MSSGNKISTKIETEKTIIEATMNAKLSEFKTDNKTIFNSLYMNLSALNSDKPSYYYEQYSSDIFQCPPLKSPEKSSHASKFTKHLSSMAWEGDTLIQIEK